MQEEFTCIDDIQYTYNIEFSDIEKEQTDVILDIFNKKISLQYTYPSEIVNIFGIYYRFHLKDTETMKKCFLSAIMRNNDRSRFNLANYYYCNKDFINAIKYLKPLVEKENLEAMHCFGNYYYYWGENTNDNDFRTFCSQQMEKYLHKAIEKNYMKSANFLGSLYSLKKDYVKSKHYYTVSAYSDNIIGIISLANYYINIEKKYDEVKLLLNKAINFGEQNAAFILANFYKDVEKNEEEMIKNYIKAIELGHIDSIYQLGLYYQSKEDYKNMIKYYMICIKKGHISGVNNLYYYYKNNNNNDLAKKILIYASKLKNPLGYINLAKHYYSEENIKKMHYYYNKAYNLPKYICPIKKININPRSHVMFYIGEYYEQTKNYQAAKRCYLRAFEENFSLASYALGKLYQHFIHNYDLMKKYYDISIKEYKCSTSLNNMIEYYAGINNLRSIRIYYSIGVNLKLKVDKTILVKYMISKMIPAGRKEDCMICYEEHEMFFSNCENHPMCMKCSMKLYLSPCPYCRKRPREE